MIVISFLFVCNSFFSVKLNDIISFGVPVIVFILSYVLLHKKANNKFSLNIIKSIAISLVLLLGLIYLDTTFNDTKIIDFLLGLKGQSHYEGETKSSALTSLFLSNIYPIILVICLIIFMVKIPAKNNQ